MAINSGLCCAYLEALIDGIMWLQSAVFSVVNLSCSSINGRGGIITGEEHTTVACPSCLRVNEMIGGTTLNANSVPLPVRVSRHEEQSHVRCQVSTCTMA